MVVARADIASVPAGTLGVVVHIYADGDAYEVEFIVNGTSFVETALPHQIEKKK
ncbi:MAG: DUF4926 domain-containing protein [Saprospiraceae bacterium]|nr:DUF4926 domain-containing protein [Saprospiraceae bacterium]